MPHWDYRLAWRNTSISKKIIFITGGTGYIGQRLISALLQRGHAVRALVRQGSEQKLPAGCTPFVGDALNAGSFAAFIPPADTFVQLIGTPHPSPAKAGSFRRVDRVSIQASIQGAAQAGIKHFVYLSVAQPAPIMKTYQAIRAEGEAMLQTAGLRCTILRPWYVLGPGHWWPVIFVPFYWLAERWSVTREAAYRLGFVSITQMVEALVDAVENPPESDRVWSVREIRNQTRRADPVGAEVH